MEFNSDELVGGLKNALLRGESLEKAKRSFLNAGYKPVEVLAAAKRVSELGIEPIGTEEKKVVKEVVKVKKGGFFGNFFKKDEKKVEKDVDDRKEKVVHRKIVKIKPLPVGSQKKRKKLVSKILVIVLIIVSGLILTAAAILGLFWDKIF